VKLTSGQRRASTLWRRRPRPVQNFLSAGRIPVDASGRCRQRGGRFQARWAICLGWYEGGLRVGLGRNSAARDRARKRRLGGKALMDIERYPRVVFRIDIKVGRHVSFARPFRDRSLDALRRQCLSADKLDFSQSVADHLKAAGVQPVRYAPATGRGVNVVVFLENTTPGDVVIFNREELMDRMARLMKPAHCPVGSHLFRLRPLRAPQGVCAGWSDGSGSRPRSSSPETNLSGGTAPPACPAPGSGPAGSSRAEISG
jgi:hypothetical protein